MDAGRLSASLCHYTITLKDLDDVELSSPIWGLNRLFRFLYKYWLIIVGAVISVQPARAAFAASSMQACAVVY